MSRYTSVTENDRQAMLAEIGVGSIEELFGEIPAEVRLNRPLDLPAGLSEQEVFDELKRLAANNVSVENEISFLGAGMYDHYVPALIDSILSRSEFLTPYTPYQPEVSQGGLQVMFEYQTAISELTGLPVSNASVYDGPSALAAAAYLAKLTQGSGKLLVSAGLHPDGYAALVTHAAGFGMEVVELPLNDFATDPADLAALLDDDVSAVFLQQPNFFGVVEDLAALQPALKQAKALSVLSCDPLTLGVLRPPGEFGFDIAVGEGQTLGNRLDFGGPSFGLFAAAERYIRKMPGRIAGETVDADGRRGFVLTLQTREQHIRREKATSNICTAQALNALAGMIYLAWLGKTGIAELGELLVKRTAYARERLGEIEGVELLHSRPVVREFGLRLPGLDVARVVARCHERGVNPGFELARTHGSEYADGLLVALTERRSRGQIDRLVEVLGAAIAEEQAVRETVGAAL